MQRATAGTPDAASASMKCYVFDGRELPTDERVEFHPGRQSLDGTVGGGALPCPFIRPAPAGLRRAPILAWSTCGRAPCRSGPESSVVQGRREDMAWNIVLTGKRPDRSSEKTRPEARPVLHLGRTERLGQLQEAGPPPSRQGHHRARSRRGFRRLPRLRRKDIAIAPEYLGTLGTGAETFVTAIVTYDGLAELADPAPGCAGYYVKRFDLCDYIEPNRAPTTDEQMRRGNLCVPADTVTTPPIGPARSSASSTTAARSRTPRS